MATFNIDINFSPLEKELRMGADDRKMFEVLMEKYDLQVKLAALHNEAGKFEKEKEELDKMKESRRKIFKWMQRLVYIKAYFMCREMELMEPNNMYHDPLRGEKYGNPPMMPEICGKLHKLWEKK